MSYEANSISSYSFAKDTSETIAALATPPGQGSIAVIRVSGPEAVQRMALIYSGPLESYTSHSMHVGKILSREGRPIDEVVIAVMRAPRSYTGEDTVEIQCHGGILVASVVLQAVLQTGVRPALPGEFTFRAFMNGKIDLTQAEAVQQLIAARNQEALHSAQTQLGGKLSQKIENFQETLVEIIAFLEASIDFPEEVDPIPLESLSFQLQQLRSVIERLCATFHQGKRIHYGPTVCLTGGPNVGKSSLMNALLGEEKAIVTEFPGTTRDIVEAEMQASHFHIRLIDTAGIRETSDPVEQEGVRRARQTMKEADLVLLVVDSTKGLQELDLYLIEQLNPNRTVIVWNKIDLPSSYALPEKAVPISAKEKEGFHFLHDTILQKMWGGEVYSREELVISSMRHKEALERTVGCIQAALYDLQIGMSPEFVVAHLRQGFNELGTVVGKDIREEILSSIFSRFCIGK